MPGRATVNTRRHDGLGRIVPDDAVAFVGDQEGYAHRFAGGRIVVVPTVDGAAPIIQNPLLILPEPVVMLVGRCVESRPRAKGFLAVNRVRRHLPTGHLQDWSAFRRAYLERYAGEGSRKVALRLARCTRPGLRLHLERHSRGGEHIARNRRLMRPPRGICRAYEAVARRGHRKSFIDTECYAHDVRRVRLDRHVTPVAVEEAERRCSGLARERESYAEDTEDPGNRAVPASQACYHAFARQFRLMARLLQHCLSTPSHADRFMITLP